MYPEVKQRWIEALESGEYKQGIEALRKIEGNETLYCCLGVLCQLHVQSMGLDKWVYDAGKFYYEDGEPRKNASFLPMEVMKWSGVNNRFGNLEDIIHDPSRGEELASILEVNRNDLTSEGEVSLATLNDKGFSFKKISEVIRRFF